MPGEGSLKEEVEADQRHATSFLHGQREEVESGLGREAVGIERLSVC